MYVVIKLILIINSSHIGSIFDIFKEYELPYRIDYNPTESSLHKMVINIHSKNLDEIQRELLRILLSKWENDKSSGLANYTFHRYLSPHIDIMSSPYDDTLEEI
jgi:hypothetical protein